MTKVVVEASLAVVGLETEVEVQVSKVETVKEGVVGEEVGEKVVKAAAK